MAISAAALLAWSEGAQAIQPDAPFLAYQEKNKDKWAE